MRLSASMNAMLCVQVTGAKYVERSKSYRDR
jgi:hypothetical protein